MAVAVAFMALAFVAAAVASCYDHLHPPAGPGGDYPPLTDSKAPRDAD